MDNKKIDSLSVATDFNRIEFSLLNKEGQEKEWVNYTNRLLAIFEEGMRSS